MAREIESRQIDGGILNLDIQNTPTVLRDARGKVVWKLAGNTPEQNEQLGIQNIQCLFLQEFPKFNEDFPRRKDGKIAKNRREEAKGFIRERIQTQEDFYTILTASSAANRRNTPYFDGSYIVALQKAFAPWGIDINEEDNPKRRWSKERIRQDAVEFYKR